MALVLAFLLVTTGVSAGLGLLGYLDQRDRLRTTVQEDGRRAADRLAESLRSPAWNFDRTQVRQLVGSELSASRHLAWIAYDLGPRLREVCQRGDDGEVRWIPDTPLPGAADQTRLVRAPHQRADDLGSLDLAVTWEPMHRELALRRNEILIQVAVLAAVVVILAGVVVQRILVRRLGSLASLLAQAPETQGGLAGCRDEFARLVSGCEALLGRLVAVLDAIGDGVATVDRDGRVQRLNPSARHALGLERRASGGLRLEALLHGLPGGRQLAAEVLARVIAGGETLAPEEPLAIADGGGERSLLFSAHPLRQGGQVAGAVLVLRDVTVENAARGRLLQAEKLESIGRMAGGIAHDFNNLLTVIVSSAELSLDCEDRARRHALVRNILQAAAQAADFNRKLLAFARKDTIHRATIDLRQVVEQAGSLLTHASNGRMQVSTQVPSSPVVADVDRSALVNCLINLGVNARDAMPDGGRFAITLATSAEGGGALTGHIHGQVPAGPCALIHAVDQGCGIPPSLLPRIFEPFFTTKPLGEGTGLGLAAVYGTMRSHHGAIGVRSRPGCTEFTLVLPLTSGRPAGGGDGDPPHGRWHGSGTVLLVDDDATVRSLGKAMLETMGFEVLAAADGAQAVTAFHQRRDDIRLVLMDILMPVMTGEVAAAQMREIDPAVRIIFITGYSGGAEGDAVARGACAVLAKPYHLEELHAAVRRALEGAPPPPPTARR